MIKQKAAFLQSSIEKNNLNLKRKEENMLTFKTNVKCRKCGKFLRTTDVKDYSFTCFDCDENFYGIEQEIPKELFIDMPMNQEMFDTLEIIVKAVFPQDTKYFYSNETLSVILSEIPDNFYFIMQCISNAYFVYLLNSKSFHYMEVSGFYKGEREKYESMGFHCYDFRDADCYENGYQIEKYVLCNNIGGIVTSFALEDTKLWTEYGINDEQFAMLDALGGKDDLYDIISAKQEDNQSSNGRILSEIEKEVYIENRLELH